MKYYIVKKYQNMSNKNRSKGHNAERYFAKIFREEGFADCKTARYASREMDDLKIDLVNLPFNVQIKAGIQKSLKVEFLILEIKKLLKQKNRPDLLEKPLIIIHKKDGIKGFKREETQEMAYMSFNDFIKLLKVHDKKQ